MEKIIDFFEKQFPSSKAAEWDNVGHLINISGIEIKNVLLTIDLTENVLDEAIEKKIDLIITYHPVIFTPLTQISSFYTKIILNGINVYTFHTSADSFMSRMFLNEIFDNKLDEGKAINPFSIDNEFIAYCKNNKQLSVQKLANCIKQYCEIEYIRVAYAENQTPESVIKDVYFGCGSAKFSNIKNSLIIAGEMSHHFILKELKEKNTVMLLEHCQSERWFLMHLKMMLEKSVKDLKFEISEKNKGPLKLI
ncbi:Ngg1-interacting factor 3 protein NIF3L1 [Pseudoloma neurophilia]|uniref:Ngg1-interacting factor 3 protein NIF3L1 n=1 Tax=Pseudoloma neurophilia TaxID=146866 RepID=A0A0R0M8D8_9MICR|nr:Ngg1-interacting factor 3 protein NIF3L1 [Pseudoloma neurophilia]